MAPPPPTPPFHASLPPLPYNIHSYNLIPPIIHKTAPGKQKLLQQSTVTEGPWTFLEPPDGSEDTRPDPSLLHANWDIGCNSHDAVAPATPLFFNILPIAGTNTTSIITSKSVTIGQSIPQPDLDIMSAPVDRHLPEQDARHNGRYPPRTYGYYINSELEPFRKKYRPGLNPRPHSPAYETEKMSRRKPKVRPKPSGGDADPQEGYVVLNSLEESSSSPSHYRLHHRPSHGNRKSGNQPRLHQPLPASSMGLRPYTAVTPLEG